MVIHKDSLEDSVLNQFKSNFQTVIYSKQMTLDTNEANLKYQIEIENRNFKTAKMTVYVNKKYFFSNFYANFMSSYWNWTRKNKNETIYLNRDFEIKRVEKPNLFINKTSANALNERTSINDQFKGLTFNVHTNSNDLETKNQLVLPYELIGFVNHLSRKFSI